VNTISQCKTAGLGAILVFLMIGLFGCRPGPQLLGSIQTAGGVEVLKKECADLASKLESARTDFIDKTNYPPVIAKLNPQIVEIEKQRSFPFVHIQVTGGFSHRGLLIAAKSLPADFVPVRGGGGKWRVWKLADGVFEYRE
jgi:hypothetical protein